MQIKHWHDKHIDPELYMQLQDLTTVLSQIQRMRFDFAFGSFLDLNDIRLTANTFWDMTETDIQEAGYKTDIYLRSIGTLHHSKLNELAQLLTFAEKENMPLSFTTQIFTLLEDLRLQALIMTLRPGTANDFKLRNNYLYGYFSTQLQIRRADSLDRLFCQMFLSLYANQLDDTLIDEQHIKNHLYDVFSARSTKDICHIVIQILWKLDPEQDDMTQTYMTSPILQTDSLNHEHSLFDQLKRTDDTSGTKDDMTEEADYSDETFSSWHEERKNKDEKESFLQMNIDLGTKTGLSGGEARDTESGDQAFATAHGHSRQSKKKDYSKEKTLDRHDDQRSGNDTGSPFGEDNIHAVKHIKRATKPNENDIITYNKEVARLDLHIKKITRTLEKLLQHKKDTVGGHLHYGRLSKRLLPLFLEKQPRIFYKKNEDSNEFDAIFTLMIDCSASMDQKMTDTKRTVILFHKVLKSLNIRHRILGFWEEAKLLNEKIYPNFFHIIHSFSDNLYEENGPKIMQLRAEEDNRDGFSIRVETEKMLTHHAKHKFLLVFSDGEPAAANYDENGIIDTQIAVANAKKKGIDVIGIHLADGLVNEDDEKMMKTIYGRTHINISDVSQLHEHFIPLFKKLLIKTLL